MAITGEGKEEAVEEGVVEEVGEEEASMYNVEYIPRVSCSNYLRLYRAPVVVSSICICIFYVFHVAWQQLWQEQQLWPIKATTPATATARTAIDKRASSSQKPSVSHAMQSQARLRNADTNVSVSVSPSTTIEWMLSLFCPGAWAGSAQLGPACQWPTAERQSCCYSCCTLLLYMT